MDKGDFKSWDDAIKFYKEEYKDLPLEEFMDRMTMRWEDGEFEDVQAFSREVEEGIKLYSNPPEKKSVDLEPEKKGIPIYLSKWAKEVVQLLLKKGEMKHQDILLALGGLPTSYNHISKIFKTKDAKEFLKSEIINNQSYYSLRDPSQFKK